VSFVLQEILDGSMSLLLSLGTKEIMNVKIEFMLLLLIGLLLIMSHILPLSLSLKTKQAPGLIHQVLSVVGVIGVILMTVMLVGMIVMTMVLVMIVMIVMTVMTVMTMVLVMIFMIFMIVMVVVLVGVFVMSSIIMSCICLIM